MTMHPLDAIATLVEYEDIPSATPTQQAAHLVACRTLADLDESERRRWVASTLGISPHHAKWYETGRDTHARAPQGRTALYRHYDDAGRLLYLGISSDPDKRLALHAYTARWHQYATRCEVEWFPTRAAAARAEGAAIIAERPLFNLAGSVVPASEADDYLAAVER